jgi:hypothetical protein
MDEEKQENVRKATHVTISHHDDEEGEHAEVVAHLEPKSLKLKIDATIARDSDFVQQLKPLIAKFAPPGFALEDDNAAPIHPQAAAQARASQESGTVIITDAQREIGEVVVGFEGLPTEALTAQVLAQLEAHLRRRLPGLKNVVRLLELPPEDPMMDPVENSRARILGVVHEAGGGGIPLEDLENAVGVREGFREALGQIVEDGRIEVRGEDNRVFWVTKPGEEINDLGVLNSCYDGQPQPDDD